MFDTSQLCSHPGIHLTPIGIEWPTARHSPRQCEVLITSQTTSAPVLHYTPAVNRTVFARKSARLRMDKSPISSTGNSRETGGRSECESGSSKRIRLSLACNQCRKRKVRCDTETPKCRNCWLRGEVCETTDPRCPDNGLSVRRWATKDGLLPGQNPAATHRNQAQVPKQSPVVPAIVGAGTAGQTPTSSERDRRADGMLGCGESNHPPLLRRWSTSASVSAFTDASAQQRHEISASPLALQLALASPSPPPGPCRGCPGDTMTA
jgi:hypothetical protein